MSSTHKAHFLLVLIPSRETVVTGPTAEAQAYDVLERLMRQAAIPYLDLRVPFSRSPAHGSRYYFPLDGHWTVEGILEAARRILHDMKEQEQKDAASSIRSR